MLKFGFRIPLAVIPVFAFYLRVSSTESCYGGGKLNSHNKCLPPINPNGTHYEINRLVQKLDQALVPSVINGHFRIWQEGVMGFLTCLIQTFKYTHTQLMEHVSQHRGFRHNSQIMTMDNNIQSNTITQNCSGNENLFDISEFRPIQKHG